MAYRWSNLREYHQLTDILCMLQLINTLSYSDNFQRSIHPQELLHLYRKDCNKNINRLSMLLRYYVCGLYCILHVMTLTWFGARHALCVTSLFIANRFSWTQITSFMNSINMTTLSAFAVWKAFIIILSIMWRACTNCCAVTSVIV